MFEVDSMRDQTLDWDEVVEDLRRGGIGLDRPIFVIVGSLNDEVGEQIHGTLPRIPLRPIESYEKRDPLQVYGDDKAIYLTWSCTREAEQDNQQCPSGSMSLDDLRGFVRSIQTHYGNLPAIRGAILQVPALWLSENDQVFWAAEQCRRVFSVLWEETQTHFPIFVLVTDFLPVSGDDANLSSSTVFPFDLGYHERSPSRVAIAQVPGLLARTVQELVGHRLTAQAWRLAPPCPSDDREIRRSWEWFQWLAELEDRVRDTPARLDYLLRMAVIGAYGVKAEYLDPSRALRTHEFRASSGPILLAACHLSSEVESTFLRLLEDLRAHQWSVCWTDQAMARDNLLSRLSWFGYLFVGLSVLGLLIAMLLYS